MTSIQSLYDKKEYQACLDALNELPSSSAVEHNKLITRFYVDQQIETLMERLQSTEELSLDQQVLFDYNRALALSKYQRRFDEAIDILENRMLVLTEPFGVVDERLAFKLFYLLAVIYIERKRNLQKALNLLQIIADKCDPNQCPARLQYMKVKCYLFMGNVKKVKKKLKFLSPVESLAVRVYIELAKGTPLKAYKAHKEGVTKKDLAQLNNEVVIRTAIGSHSLSLLGLDKCGARMPPEVLYNFAFLHLLTGNSTTALATYKVLARAYPRNPKLWLRLAECYALSWSRDRSKFMVAHSPPLRFLGDHAHRKAILPSMTIPSEKSIEDLRMIRGCSLNAVHLLEQEESVLSFYPSNHLSESQLVSFKCSAYTLLTFSSLQMQDYAQVQFFASKAQENSPSAIQRMLIASYLAEARACGNGALQNAEKSIKDALSVLNSESKAISQDNDFTTNVKAKLLDWGLEKAAFTLRYNLATCLALRCKYDEAEKELTRCQKDGNSSNSLIGNTYFADLLDVYLAQMQHKKIHFPHT